MKFLCAIAVVVVVFSAIQAAPTSAPSSELQDAVIKAGKALVKEAEDVMAKHTSDLKKELTKDLLYQVQKIQDSEKDLTNAKDINAHEQFQLLSKMIKHQYSMIDDLVDATK